MPAKAERVFVGVGANQPGRRRVVAAALNALRKLPTNRGFHCSPLYETSPWGGVPQPDFLNAVVELKLRLDPHEALDELLGLEYRLKRRRQAETRWGPRVVDLDLLAHGDRVVQRPGLVVPHPRLAQRRFVLQPWSDLAPEFEVPGLGLVADLLRACTDAVSVTRLENGS
ncbi:MAG: 2-amino-4-hydroxy-6-hydroxymethyldihydropteridine diphosphokinase [Pseudomonadota bacterium]